MVGHHLGQLFLRIGLATTFVIAGLAKVLPDDQYSGQDAAILANMKVFNPQTTGNQGGGGGGGGEGAGGTTPTSGPTSWNADPMGSDATAWRTVAFRQTEASQPEQPETTPSRPSRTRPTQNNPGARPATPEAEAAQPQTPAAPETNQPAREDPERDQPAAQPAQNSTPAGPGPLGGQYTATDFPDPVALPRVYRIALMLYHGAHPGVDANGKAKMALVPTWATDTKVPGIGMATPVVLAWAAAIAEVVGGGMLLVGFMSRLWALGLVGVMGVAIWLTTIGPAMQSGTAYMGFLPNNGPLLEHPEAYNHAILQLICLCMALAVMFAGPGAISIDGILFGGKDDEGGGDGE